MHDLRDSAISWARGSGHYEAVFEKTPTDVSGDLSALVVGEVAADIDEAKNVTRTLFNGSYQLELYVMMREEGHERSDLQSLVGATLRGLSGECDLCLAERPTALRFFDGHVHPYDLHFAEVHLSKPTLLDINEL